MEYDIVEDFKRIKDNRSILDVCKIAQQVKLLLNSLKYTNIKPTIAKGATKIENNSVQNMTINVSLLGKR
jgi:hypothetical protein